jgi:prevent-host-death family protein
MKFSTVRDLKAKTSALLRTVAKGQPVVVTRHGRPTAVITPLHEGELEDFLFEHSPILRKRIAEGLKDIEKGRVVSHETLKTRLLARRKKAG